jgi:hypothetical protein
MFCFSSFNVMLCLSCLVCACFSKETTYKCLVNNLEQSLVFKISSNFAFKNNLEKWDFDLNEL